MSGGWRGSGGGERPGERQQTLEVPMPGPTWSDEYATSLSLSPGGRPLIARHCAASSATATASLEVPWMTPPPPVPERCMKRSGRPHSCASQSIIS